MSEAIFGLVGVVIGGVLTGAVETWGEWRRRQADRRQGMRLVAEDVNLILLEMKLISEAGRWPVPQTRLLLTDAWDSHRQMLARELDGQRWRNLAALMGTVPTIRAMATRDAGQEIPAAQLKYLREGVEHFAYLYQELTGRAPVEIDTDDGAPPMGTNGH